MERKNDDFGSITTLKEALAKAEENISLLKEENKRYLKENTKLQQELQFINNSRKYKYAGYLSDIYKNPIRILDFAAKLISKILKKIRKMILFYIRKLRKINNVNDYKIENMESINVFEKCPENKIILKTATVIVCVYNALDDVRECLHSLINNRSFPYQILIIDDGSEINTARFLKKIASLDYISYIRNEKPKGYTKAANIGLRETDNDYLILLNSDTIVTQGWVEKLIECFEQNENTGIVSALSNSASYQSVPEIRDIETGDWKINKLNPNINIEMMGWIIEKESLKKYPKVRCLNGFCLVIKREVIDQIGYLDEEQFPRGYGEEVDFCIRAYQAGYELRVADNVYIFHKKTKSFKQKDRNKLVLQAAEKLRNKYAAFYDDMVRELEKGSELNEIRNNIVQKLEYYLDICTRIKGKKIAFLVTAAGGSGGVNSICQEVIGMRAFGIDAHIFNSYDYQEQFDLNYPELTAYTHYFNRNSKKSLLKICSEFNLIIATIFTTMHFLKEISDVLLDKKFGYYVQDYEPFFFNEGEENYHEAKASYNQLKDICLFAKTQWIVDTVRKNNGVEVELVQPSIDTKIYNAYLMHEKRVMNSICISAMIRPKTERRNPKGTLELFRLLKERYSEKVDIVLFGCRDEELEPYSNILIYDYNNWGILRRSEVAKVLAMSDIFVDLSTYQAFGRTGLESMCLGCLPIVPECGGANKYAADRQNAIVVDTSDIVEVYNRICEVINNSELRKNMQKAALLTGKQYSVRKAVWSEIEVFNKLF